MPLRDTIADVGVHLVETRAKGNLADSTRNVEIIGFVVVEIRTRGGLSGIGLTYHEVGGAAVRELIKIDLAPRLLGRSPLETEALYEENFHYLRGIGRKGLAFCAYSAVDIALWDLKGRMFGLPLYRLLGGKRNIVPIYASGGWTSYSLGELVDEARKMVERGYDKIKVKVGIEAGTNPREDLRRIRAVRDAVGPDIGIMLDANNVWTSATAARFANQVKELDILFLEEPVPADDIPGLAGFKRGTDLPLATGEHEYTRYGVRDLIVAGAVDILQADIVRCGGFTEMSRIAALSQAWNLRLAPHGMEHMHMHFLAAAANGIFLERLLMYEEAVEATFENAPVPENGRLRLPEAPGLGLSLREEVRKS
ncbi:MAG: mandelate racemase/muconate lactonizing enzyme family protein [Planctomycetota bacterium]|jgi:D-arabinonate dehydratase|nr:mandelate racemase/muconate lactonizing enzyme family protein [Planctomycetota bacterium]